MSLISVRRFHGITAESDDSCLYGQIQTPVSPVNLLQTTLVSFMYHARVCVCVCVPWGGFPLIPLTALVTAPPCTVSSGVRADLAADIIVPSAAESLHFWSLRSAEKQKLR